MCHPDVPPGQATPQRASVEVQIAVVDGSTMPALLTPVDDASRPAVLIVGDIFGCSPFYEHLAALLAQAGFQALVPDFFFRQGPLAEMSRDAAFARRSKLDEAQTVNDLSAAIEWLRAHSSGETIGMVGFCMGGTFVLDLASSGEHLVTVAYYGFPVPQATMASPPPRPIDLVQSLAGPVLAFWGEEDEVVGLHNVKTYVELARAANSNFEHEIVTGLGHGFLGSAELGNPEDPAAATWERALAHLRRNLLQKES